MSIMKVTPTPAPITRPKPYDHAANHEPAKAHAIERARQDSLERGDALMLVASWDGEDYFTWTGSPHAVRQLAADLTRNGAAYAKVTVAGFFNPYC